MEGFIIRGFMKRLLLS